jgi:hypothetical protein
VEHRIGLGSQGNLFNEQIIKESPTNLSKDLKLNKGRVFAANALLRIAAFVACPGDDIAALTLMSSQTTQHESPAIVNQPPIPIRVARGRRNS